MRGKRYREMIKRERERKEVKERVREGQGREIGMEGSDRVLIEKIESTRLEIDK